MITDLVTKNEASENGAAKLLKRKWLAMQDLNL